ncbi:Alpha/Beta hydrolase protein [Aspergillus aurantiobrunneus]
MPLTPLTTTYKRINSSTITTDIYLPPPSPTINVYPVLINIHGGAFMLGHSAMVSMPQIDDCLARNWIVACPNHRLCPGIDVRSGPMTDLRDFLAWIYAGGLDAFLQGQGQGGAVPMYRVDMQRVMAFGTSSGGFLALALGYDVPRPPRAILNFYGAVHLTNPSWRKPLPHVQSKLPPGGFAEEFLAQVYSEFPIPTTSGISLEGQEKAKASTGTDTDTQPNTNTNRPDFSRPRDAFVLTQIANGTVVDAIFPRDCGDVTEIDPVSRVDVGFPPTFIVHGDEDRMVPVEVSRRLFDVLRGKGVECGMVEVPGEDHTFAMGIEVGSRAWEVSREGFEWLERVIRD